MEQQLLTSSIVNLFLVLALLACVEPAFFTLALVVLPFAVVLSQEDGYTSCEKDTIYKCIHYELEADREGAQHLPCGSTQCQLSPTQQAAAQGLAGSLEHIQQQLTPIKLVPSGLECAAGVAASPRNFSTALGKQGSSSFSRLLQRTESPRGVWELPLDEALSPQASTTSELSSQASDFSPLASPRRLSPRSSIRGTSFVITSRQLSMERQLAAKGDAPLALPSPAGSPLAAKVASGEWVRDTTFPARSCNVEARKPLSGAVADVVAFYEARVWNL